MSSLRILGGRQLKGRIAVGGAKNSCLKLLALSLMASGECSITHVPNILDVHTMCELLRALGARVSSPRTGVVEVDPRPATSTEPPEHLVRQMRASVQVLGPVLARFGEIRMPFPGGCPIGSRPIDLHIKGLSAMGAQFSEEHGYIIGRADRLTGTEIHLDFPSVGATENIMAAACLARGTTVIRNAAREPEIVDQQNFLTRLGAEIRGAGTDTIRITGVEGLGATSYPVMPDRIEAGTYLIAAVATQGDVTIEDVVPEHLEAVAAKLEEVGAVVLMGADSVRVVMNGRPAPCAVKSMPYPGFPTDLHAPMAALLTFARGTSIVTENIFSNRFRYVDELVRMGARIQVDGRTAVIREVSELSAARVAAPDLRAGAALVVAGLAAKGETVIERMEHVERGYENLSAKLSSLGAQVEWGFDRRVAASGI
ncbi:MAG: UDP-N-acetylglucosamine 1-carboxyvinyltransferase [Firmicutes bacterium]|jgi:UDP-N-acetylglucosamine 1-carboxyvinyltransferase|nr:UDP-N-acetylglucosamine 1-carboxyvinyltransferase [Bacillota bacterium]